MQILRDYLRTEPDINDETRSKFAFLNSSGRKRKSKNSKYVEEKYANDINSTGSFLSNLSVTQSEDDFLDEHSIGGPYTKQPWKKHRPSGNYANNSYIDDGARKSRKSEGISGQRRVLGENNAMEIGCSDKIRATTKVSIPRNGPIEASSVIEAIPQANQRVADTEDDSAAYKSPPTSPIRTFSRATTQITPSAPPLHELNNPKLLLNLQGRQHQFNSKTFLRPDTCAYCLKK